jgi:CDP-diacylglycerol--glycerol-3-phosphate 3-phosphatidyltransferase
LFDGRWRTHLDSATRPVGTALRRTGISADHLTALGLGVAAATAVAVGTGHLLIGLFLLVASAVPDMLDGAVAKASGTASPRGAFFDSVADRASDSLVLGGIAWHLASVKGGHWAVLALAVLALSTIISYERARAESLGYQAKGGLMERAERIVALCLGLAFPVLLIPVLWVMLALTALTAAQRFVRVWRQASGPAKPVEGKPVEGKADRSDRAQPTRWQAWQAWREQAVQERAARAPRHRGRERGGRWSRRAGTRP